MGWDICRVKYGKLNESATKFRFDESRQWYNMQNDIGEEHGAGEKKVESKIKPESQIVVIGWVSQVVTFHEIVSSVGVSATFFHYRMIFNLNLFFKLLLP